MLRLSRTVDALCNNSRVRFWLGALVVGIAAVAVFAPAMVRVFASDHLWYFADLGGTRSLLTALSFADYSLSRATWPGDDAIFRPLTYVWFGLQHWAWGTNHVAWNVTNLAMHCAVAIAVWRLLHAIRSSRAVLPLAMLVAVAMPPMEMVVWSNVGGFVWATLLQVCGLGALLARLHTHPGVPARSQAIWWAMLMTAAVGFAEFSLALAVVGAFAWTRAVPPTSVGRWEALLAWTPVLIFGAAYTWHLWRVSIEVGHFDNIVSLIDLDWLMRVPGRFAVVLALWCYEVAVPGVVSLPTIAFERLGVVVEYPPARGMALLGLVLGVASILWGSRLVGGKHWRMAWRFPLVSALVPLGILLIFCVARQRSEMMNNSYYLYPCFVLGVVAMYANADVTRITAGTRTALRSFLWCYVALNAAWSFSTSLDIRRANLDAHQHLSAINNFVAQHRHEEDFTFSLRSRDARLDPSILLGAGVPGSPSWERTVTQILYAPYLVAHDAKYRFPGVN